MLAWGALVVSTIDNVLKPLIISRGSDLPFVLVLLGVLGGVVAFGFIGVFLGPVLLAVGYVLMQAWVKTTSAIARTIARARVTGCAHTGEQNATPFGPAPSGTHCAVDHRAANRQVHRVAMIRIAPVVEEAIHRQRVRRAVAVESGTWM